MENKQYWDDKDWKYWRFRREEKICAEKVYKWITGKVFDSNWFRESNCTYNKAKRSNRLTLGRVRHSNVLRYKEKGLVRWWFEKAVHIDLYWKGPYK